MHYTLLCWRQEYALYEHPGPGRGFNRFDPVPRTLRFLPVVRSGLITYLWLVGNEGMGYNYNYCYYHSSIPY